MVWASRLFPFAMRLNRVKMTHIIRAFHQFGAYLGKVANATFVNPRNEQK